VHFAGAVPRGLSTKHRRSQPGESLFLGLTSNVLKAVVEAWGPFLNEHSNRRHCSDTASAGLHGGRVCSDKGLFLSLHLYLSRYTHQRDTHKALGA